MPPLQTIHKVLAFYADPKNYQDGAPGEALLFGWEHDGGKRAKVAIDCLQQVEKQLSNLKKQVATFKDKAKKSKPEVIANVYLDVWIKTWAATQRVPLFAQAWQGYTRHGLGVVIIVHQWVVDQTGNLSFGMKSHYRDRTQVEADIPDPWRTELLALMAQYQPEHQAIVLFCGHDLSQSKNRQSFSTARNYFRSEIWSVGEGESTAEMASAMGLQQAALNEDTF